MGPEIYDPVSLAYMASPISKSNVDNSWATTPKVELHIYALQVPSPGNSDVGTNESWPSAALPS